jgi:predicted RNase H-like nuclease (RuvC/YqgF family)
VNELNLEIENYETQILEMQSEIDRNLQEGGLDSQKHRLIKDLEKKLIFIKAQIDMMEKD